MSKYSLKDRYTDPETGLYVNPTSQELMDSASPQIIGRFENPLNDKNYFVKRQAELTQNPKVKKLKINNNKIKLFIIKFPKRGVLFATDLQGNLFYESEYIIKNFSNLGNSVVQTIVHVKTGINPVDHIASKIMSSVLINITGTLVSDNKQTDKGRGLWVRTLVEARKRGLKAGYINTKINKIEYLDLKNDPLLNTVLDDLYGVDDSFRNFRLFITKG